ncbi:UDP-glucose 6-dehydrogenase [Nocardioides phosphati]|uniref:UDP-glucose 6-dehydrogenase n=1 Tax=Nocardioides phosphati TaxID=1867775 RepID=A0ABQ2NG85_9ACTN|nr:UDP-glucose/GDP-mannose dehydrogenase family protein [Nocardioides phosphati]GGO93558.1 UDP-glucose 6-dehydrogenase [Nocardioides phosphati]
MKVTFAEPTGTVMSVFGCGYLGAVHAAAMVAVGHTVIGIEPNAQRRENLAEGRTPFFEPGFEELLGDAIATGRLRFTDDPAAAAEATIHFLCVGTPQTAGQQKADLSYLEAAFTGLLPHLKAGDVIAGKSTVPANTAGLLNERVVEHGSGARLVWNPEFLREGYAIEDTLRPERVVIGVGDDAEDRAAGERLAAAYAGLETDGPLIVTDLVTAELAKVASNAYLATKISFINAMAELCDVAGADVSDLADIMGADSRIGRKFLNAGIGFGGGCLPKDIRAFMHRAGELGAADTLFFLREVDRINLQRREAVVELATVMLGGDLSGKRVTVLGAAFKPDSDDIRDSPSLAIAAALHGAGAHVRVTDPHAIRNAREASPQLDYVDDIEKACTEAELVVLLTEWRQFRDLDPAATGELVSGRKIIDGRNVLDAAAWRAAGWEYRCLGRPRLGG